MPDLSDWYIFIQDKLKICINLSLDKYKCMKLIQFCTLYFIFSLIITSSHVLLKTVLNPDQLASEEAS